MNLEKYLEQKQKLAAQAPKYRELCHTCLQPDFSCYCSEVQKFDPLIDFVILIHPIEVRRRIATGRMSHLCLQNSHLIMGQDFTKNERVTQLANSPEHHAVILYPGIKSKNISSLPAEERAEIFPSDKKLMIFVIDGTWATAGRMVRSQNLNSLPRICFSPTKPSNFRVRKQPAPGCYSTIEAIHHTIELMGASRGFNLESREHDKLLHVFDHMVERQLDCKQKSEARLGALSYRRKLRKPAENKDLAGSAAV